MASDIFVNPELMRGAISRVPLQRIGTTRDVAFGALFLASDESRMVNGATIPADGGISAY